MTLWSLGPYVHECYKNSLDWAFVIKLLALATCDKTPREGIVFKTFKTGYSLGRWSLLNLIN